MPRNTSNWILLTNPHLTETYIPPEGDVYEYHIAPTEDIKKGDTVYLWWNAHSYFYGWGVIAEATKDFYEQNAQGDKRKRRAIAVNRIKGFNPSITRQMMLADTNLKKMIPTGFDDLCAIPLRPGQANYFNDYIREHKLDAPQGSTTVSWIFEESAPQIILQTLLTLGDQTKEGRLIEDVRIAWDEIIKTFARNPEEIYDVDPRKFEEIIAGAYKRAGYDEVILTPQSNDKGRDVIATKHGFGSIRIVDQVKRYKISHLVDADEVRALVGVVYADPSVSKGVITTTSMFAPKLLEDENIKRLVPHRLELRDRDNLLAWFKSLHIRS